MKNNIWTIARKEFSRFFKDKGMVFSTILLPGLMIYVLYTFMGSGMSSMFGVDEEFVPKMSVVNMPESIDAMVETFDVTDVTSDQIEEIKAELQDKNAVTNLLVVFPENFDVDVMAYDNLTATNAAPNVEVYYNSASTDSSEAYQIFFTILEQYETVLSNKFDVNAGEAVYDMATEEDTTGQIFASMLPMLMMIFMFSGCMAVAPEAIAGEKERGTMATLLVTPLKRRELAIGKVLSLGVIALLSGLSSFLGTYLSLPSLMGAASDQMDASIYGTTDFIMLFLIILSTVLVIIGMICVVSALAKSVKEAGSYITPLMIASMVIGITAMFGSGAKEEIYYYFIPLYNTVQSMLGIFSLDYNIVNIVVTVVSNVVYMGIFTVVLTKMFNSERIVYSK